MTRLLSVELVATMAVIIVLIEVIVLMEVIEPIQSGTSGYHGCDHRFNGSY